MCLVCIPHIHTHMCLLVTVINITDVLYTLATLSSMCICRYIGHWVGLCLRFQRVNVNQTIWMLHHTSSVVWGNVGLTSWHRMYTQKCVVSPSRGRQRKGNDDDHSPVRCSMLWRTFEHMWIKSKRTCLIDLQHNIATCWLFSHTKNLYADVLFFKCNWILEIRCLQLFVS